MADASDRAAWPADGLPLATVEPRPEERAVILGVRSSAGLTRLGRGLLGFGSRGFRRFHENGLHE